MRRQLLRICRMHLFTYRLKIYHVSLRHYTGQFINSPKPFFMIDDHLSAVFDAIESPRIKVRR